MQNLKEIKNTISDILDFKKQELESKWKELHNKNKDIFEARQTKSTTLEQLYIQKGKIEEQIEEIHDELQQIEYDVEESVNEIQNFLFDILGLQCQVKLTPLKFRDDKY